MIEQGRADGWLKLPVLSLDSWARLQGIELNGVGFGKIKGAEQQGTAIVAHHELRSTNNPLITVPNQLILSLEHVNKHAKADHHLREVLAAVGEFGKVCWPYK